MDINRIRNAISSLQFAVAHLSEYLSSRKRDPDAISYFRQQISATATVLENRYVYIVET